jgi:hypothetical protein
MAVNGSDSYVLIELSGVILVCEKAFLKNRNYFKLFQVRPDLMKI